MSSSHQSIVADQFGAHASAYVSSPVHSAGADLDLLDGLLAARRPARVLDLGTGGGHVAFRAAAHAVEVVAYDLSREMLAAVEAEAARRGLRNVVTRHGPAEELPFGAAGFDAVLTRFSAHHWHDVPRALAEARLVLKPGGLAVVADVTAAEAPLADTWLQALELMRDGSHVRDYRLSEWRSMLAEAGFTVAAVTSYRLRMEFESWVARIGTPAPLVAGIRCLQGRMPQEVAARFALEADGSFEIETALIKAV